MDIYGWDPAECALHRYVEIIAAEFGVRPEYTNCDIGKPASAYVALDQCLPDFPDRDLSLIWDERRGWAAAIESASGGDLIVLAYLGKEPVPEPEHVIEFVRRLLAGEHPGQTRPPVFDSDADLIRRLAELTEVG